MVLLSGVMTKRNFAPISLGPSSSPLEQLADAFEFGRRERVRAAGTGPSRCPCRIWENLARPRRKDCRACRGSQRDCSKRGDSVAQHRIQQDKSISGLELVVKVGLEGPSEPVRLLSKRVRGGRAASTRFSAPWSGVDDLKSDTAG